VHLKKSEDIEIVSMVAYTLSRMMDKVPENKKLIIAETAIERLTSSLNDEPQMDLRAAKKFREGLVSYLPLLAPTEEQTRCF